MNDDFSQIALQKLLQLFPELSNYIVSFKDITEESGREESSGLQIGMFLLQIGNDYYYIPILVKDGTAMPIDSLFSVSENRFFPLTRTFIDQSISSSQVYLGKKSKIPGTVPSNPSVQNLVTPPRTGKFVYASSSRLTEFLAILPNMTKKAMLDKVSNDKGIYSALHAMFGLENILGALKSSPPASAAPAGNTDMGIKVVTEGENLPHSVVSDILSKGYSIVGEQRHERVVVMANDAKDMGPLQVIGGADLGRDYDVVTRTGEVRAAFVPKRAASAPRFAALLTEHGSGNSAPIFALFANGDYSISGNIVSCGEPKLEKHVASELFAISNPITAKEVMNGDKVAILSPDLELIGAFSVWSVEFTPNGVTMRGDNLLPGSHHYGHSTTINAYRNCSVVNSQVKGNLFIPVATTIIRLGKNVTGSLETNVNSALAKLELSTLRALGTSANIGFDGCEYSFNGQVVGPEVKMIEMLIMKEGLAPHKVESFIKQAKERRHVKIYLSKKADFEPGDIPQFGDAPMPQDQSFGADKNGAFTNNVKASLGTEDPQTVESMVISELLQAANMTDLVHEYLPEIKEAIDKLGRTLFLARLNMDQLGMSQNANEVLGFIANLRNVYRLLGDNYIKLQRMMGGPERELINTNNQVQ